MGHDMTPDELRKEADPTRLATTHIDHTSKVMRSAADAWEMETDGLRESLGAADETIVGLRKLLEQAEENYTMAYSDSVDLRKRLEAAEKACRMLAALGLENDTVGEWPEMMAAYLAAKAALAGKP